jgi:hypothetical protein
MSYSPIGVLVFVCAVISAKWALDLGFSQARQLLWGIAGLVLGPIAMFLLYVQLVRKCQAERVPAEQW